MGVPQSDRFISGKIPEMDDLGGYGVVLERAKLVVLERAKLVVLERGNLAIYIYIYCYIAI